jgi:hypothetical protein
MYRLGAIQLDDNVLSCPNCGEQYLHHEKVELFMPKHEDTNDGVHTVIDNGYVTTDGDCAGNPSPRCRDGIVIEFSCEFCNDEGGRLKQKLVIFQHKGLTIVGWKDDL